MSAWATLPAVSPGRWRVLSAELGEPAVVVSFPGSSDRAAVRAQLEQWREGLLSARACSLVIPRLVPEALNPTIAYPHPFAVGRSGLPDPHTPADVLATISL